ncbi:MAG: hypothetical protein KDI60_16190 [Xanthomonadales bacterium]|nr:hypothetical protein [Xanthomonadales bacterium]MCP5476576.1 hypothetical protein [Rhodanobacteraceae bacterium]
MFWHRWSLIAGLVGLAAGFSPQVMAQIYGLSYVRDSSSLELVTVDAGNGSLGTVGPGLPGCCRLGLGSSALDLAGQSVYAVGPDPSSATHELQLLRFSTVTGAGAVVGNLGTSDRVFGLEHEVSTSRLIALLANPMGDVRLVSINKSSGAATEIHSGLADCCVLEPGLVALSGGNLLVVGRLRTETAGTRTLFSLSTSGSNLVISTSLPAGSSLAALAAASGSVYGLLQSYSGSPRVAALQLVQIQAGGGLSSIGAPLAACCRVSLDTATIDGQQLRVVARDPAQGGLSVLSFSLTTGSASFSTGKLPADRIVNALLASGQPSVVLTQSGGSTLVTEGGATDSYSLVLTTIPSSPVTITMTPDSQLSTLPTTLTFTAGDWNIPQQVVVSAVDDPITEGPHAGTITHSATGGGYDGVAIPDVTASIADNDTATLAISDVSQVEGTGGSSSFQFTVTLTGSVGSAFTVPVSSSDGSAMAGSDYTAIPAGTSLGFTGAAGQTQTATVAVQGDAIVEANETFAVVLGAPSNALVSIADGSADGTIVNDDTATVAIDNVVEAEGDSGSSSYSFAITLTGNVQDGFTLPYQSMDGTATAGSDYTSVAGTLNFTGASGQVRNVLVAVSGDTTPEADETFFVDLGTASVVGITAAPSRGTGTIVNDDLLADVSVSNSNGVSALTPGDSTIYSVVVSNTSSVVDLPAVAIVQSLSPALINVTWTCAGTGGATCPASGSGAVSTTIPMPKGSSLSYQVSATVADTLLDAIDATVTATVQSPYGDPNLANNSVTDSDPRVWDSFADGFE